MEFIKNFKNHFFYLKLLCTFGVYNKKETKPSMKQFLNIAQVQLDRLEDIRKGQRN